MKRTTFILCSWSLGTFFWIGLSMEIQNKWSFISTPTPPWSIQEHVSFNSIKMGRQHWRLPVGVVLRGLVLETRRPHEHSHVKGLDEDPSLQHRFCFEQLTLVSVLWTSLSMHTSKSFTEACCDCESPVLEFHFRAGQDVSPLKELGRLFFQRCLMAGWMADDIYPDKTVVMCPSFKMTSSRDNDEYKPDLVFGVFKFGILNNSHRTMVDWRWSDASLDISFALVQKVLVNPVWRSTTNSIFNTHPGPMVAMGWRLTNRARETFTKMFKETTKRSEAEAWCESSNYLLSVNSKGAHRFSRMDIYMMISPPSFETHDIICSGSATLFCPLDMCGGKGTKLCFWAVLHQRFRSFAPRCDTSLTGQNRRTTLWELIQVDATSSAPNILHFWRDPYGEWQLFQTIHGLFIGWTQWTEWT